jgi:hypothetical protein
MYSYLSIRGNFNEFGLVLRPCSDASRRIKRETAAVQAVVGIAVWPILRNLAPGIRPTEIEVFVEVFSLDPLLDNRILDLGAMSSF